MDIKLVYALISLLFEALLIFIILKLYTSDYQNAKELMYPIFTGIIALPVNTCLFLATNHSVAMLLDSIYFMLNDWLALFLMSFVFRYSSDYKSTVFGKILALFCVLDSINLLISPFTGHMFALSAAFTENHIQYWSLELFHPFYIHLGLCYVIVFSTLLQLTVATFKAPYSYKSKYSSVLVVFFITIIVNLITYSQNLPIDISVFCYVLLGCYISYYVFFKMEKKLLSNTLEKLNESTNDIIIYFDTRGNCIYMNTNAKKILSDEQNLTALKYSGKFKLSLIADKLRNDLLESNRTVIDFNCENKQHFYTIEYKEILENSNQIGSYLTLHDETNDIIQYNKEKYAASHDMLTGIFNRQKFFAECEIKNKQNRENYMICINIRDFKLINEIFGEETGDQVLNFLATLIEKQFDQDTLYGRISDDKFAIFIPKQNFDERALSILSKNIQHILDKNTYHLQLVFGICESHGEGINVLYDKAKMAVDKLRGNPQDFIGYYDSLLMEKALVEKNITSEFDNALKTKQIQMYLQPVYDSESKIVAAEALARWNHPEKGLIMPERFIEVLEKTGFIPRLDTFIWEEALKFLENNKNTLDPDFFISINISSRDIYYIDVLETLKSLVNKYSIPGSCLVLEFNEDIFSAENSKGEILVRNLKDFGFRCVMDKFGTAYTSLNLLKDIDCDCIKINQTFVDPLNDSEKCKTILKSIISMSKDIGIKTGAVGIENPEQFNLLRAYKCDYYQGNYFSKPVNITDFEKLI